MTDSNYQLLESQLRALLADESDALAASSNFCALLYNAIDDVNWLGIYVVRENQLVLGPFQGQTACVRIDFGRGVCGNAAATRTTLRVDDVHDYPGHIACDANSRSELVVPLIRNGTLLGVLDIDSPSLSRFSEADQIGTEKLVAAFVELLPQSRSKPGFI